MFLLLWKKIPVGNQLMLMLNKNLRRSGFVNIPLIKLNTGRMIGSGFSSYIIAEIGSNHDGDIERAKMLIREAKKAGADSAKFQSFQVENLINSKWQSNGLWEQTPSWEILKKLSIPIDWHRELQKTANEVNIDFISTPFDCERLQLLENLDVPVIKIASGDLTYFELLKAAGHSGKPIFLSTGHATLGEVESALKILWETGCKDIALLHCASIYPCSFKDAYLPAMIALRQSFLVQVGYSDHTLGNTVPLGAIALGACILEKHFTDDKSREGPDHAFASDINEFTQMVAQIRQLEAALVGGPKNPRPAEKEERIMARRAVYAKIPISQGTIIQREMVRIVRHAYPEGVLANQWDQLKGKKAAVDIKENELISWNML
jgi:sialic acid synthase SpsE